MDGRIALLDLVDKYYGSVSNGRSAMREAEGALLGAKRNAQLLPAAATILAAAGSGSISTEAVVFCLSMVETFANARSCVFESGLTNSLVAAAVTLGRAPNVGARAAYALAVLARRYPALLWEAHCKRLQSQLRPNLPVDVQNHGLVMLLDTVDVMASSSVGTLSQQRESAGLIKQQVPNLITALLDMLESRPTSTSESRSAFDRAVTGPALIVIEKVVSYPSLGSDFISPRLLACILSIASEALSTSSPHGTSVCGLNALGVLTDVMSRKLISPVMGDFSSHLASHAMGVLDALTAGGQSSPPLASTLDHDVVSRFNSFLIAFATNVFPRVLENPQLPLQRLLEQAFAFTLSIRDGDAFLGILPLWGQLTTLASSASVRSVFGLAFSALAAQLLDKLVWCRSGGKTLSELGIDECWPAASIASDSRFVAAGESSESSDALGDEIAQAAKDAIGTVLAAPDHGDGGGDGDEEGDHWLDGAVAGGSAGGTGVYAGIFSPSQLASERGRFTLSCLRLLSQLIRASPTVACEVATAITQLLPAQVAAACDWLGGAAAPHSPQLSLDDSVILYVALTDAFIDLSSSQQMHLEAPTQVAVNVSQVIQAVGQAYARLHPRVMAVAALPAVLCQPVSVRLVCAHVRLSNAVHRHMALVTPPTSGSSVGPNAHAVNAMASNLSMLERVVATASHAATDVRASVPGDVMSVAGHLLDGLSSLLALPAGAASFSAVLREKITSERLHALLARLPRSHQPQLLACVFRGVVGHGKGGPVTDPAGKAGMLQRCFAPVIGPIQGAWTPGATTPALAAGAPPPLDPVACCTVLAQFTASLTYEPHSNLGILLAGPCGPVIGPLSSAVSAACGLIATPGSAQQLSAQQVALTVSGVNLLSTIVAVGRPFISDAELAPLCGSLAPALTALPSALSVHDGGSGTRTQVAIALVRLLRRIVRPGKRAPMGQAAPIASIRDAALSALTGPLASLLDSAHPAHVDLLPAVHALSRDILHHHWRFFVETGPPDGSGKRPRQFTGPSQASQFLQLASSLCAGLAVPTLSPELFRLHLLTLAVLDKAHQLLLAPGFTGPVNAGRQPLGPALQSLLLQLLGSGERRSLDDDIRKMLWAAVAHDPLAFVTGPLIQWATQVGGSAAFTYSIISLSGVRTVTGGDSPVATEVSGIVNRLHGLASASKLDASAFEDAVRDLVALLQSGQLAL